MRIRIKIFQVLLIIIIVIASILRLWKLNTPDVTPDEYHYIQDGFRLLNKDPNISIRYHAFMHPAPSIGHPFLSQISQVPIYKFLGVSVFTSRLHVAIAGIATILVIYSFKFWIGKGAVVAALIFTILPISVRYNRNAHLDSLFTLTITLTALFTYAFINTKKSAFLVLASLAAALAFSTKLNGIVALALIYALLFFGQKASSFKRLKKIFAYSIYILPPFFLLSLGLNDYGAYLDGITNPSFTGWQLGSINFWLMRLAPENLVLFIKSSFYLFSPIALLAIILAFYNLIFKGEKQAKNLLIPWTILMIPIVLMHGLGVSGSYGWLPAVPPITLVMGIYLEKSNFLQNKVFLFSLLLTTLAFTFLYGLRLRPIPTGSEVYSPVYNRTIEDNFYAQTLESVNKLTPFAGKVLLLPQNNYPIFTLRSDISWSYTGELNSFDVLVMANSEGVDTSTFKLMEVKSDFQDEENLTRLIYQKR